jgi:hypothetical protein
MPAIPICYVSDALGDSPRTPLQHAAPGTFIAWNRADRKVRMVPEVDGRSLLRQYPRDFVRCVPLADGYEGVTAEQLAELVAAAREPAPEQPTEGGAEATPARVHVEMYHPLSGGDEVEMLVLDETTLEVLARAAAAQSGAEEQTQDTATQQLAATTTTEAPAAADEEPSPATSPPSVRKTIRKGRV